MSKDKKDVEPGKVVRVSKERERFKRKVKKRVGVNRDGEVKEIPSDIPKKKL